MLPCTVSSIQFIQSQNQNKAGGEKISWLQRMRALERSWSGWGLRTIKMIHLSKIKVSRTSRMLKFELFWLKCFLCLHWTISKVYTAPILNIEMYQINVYCIKSVRVTLIFAGNTLIDDRSNVLVLTCGWLVSPAAAAWLWSVPPHPEMPRLRPDWDNQFINRQEPEAHNHSLFSLCLSQSTDEQS